MTWPVQIHELGNKKKLLKKKGEEKVAGSRGTCNLSFQLGTTREKRKLNSIVCLSLRNRRMMRSSVVNSCATYLCVLVSIVLVLLGGSDLVASFSLSEDGGRVAVDTILGDEVDSWQPPWFCHGIDCPKYSILNKNNATYEYFEERFYPAQYWTETYVTGMDYDKSVKTGFMRLFNYISGDNLMHEKIEMTAPVTVYVTPGQGPFCEDHFNISFYVPYQVQGHAPTPVEKDVYDVKREPLHVYVTSFPGRASVEKLTNAALALGENLTKLSIPFDPEHFYFAGYDSPFRLFNRHNEVWLIGSDEKKEKSEVEDIGSQ